MHPLRIPIIAMFVLLVAATSFWCFRPHRPPPANIVDPRLSRLQEPYRSVEALHFQDGGSLGIRIVDAFGVKEEFFLPARSRSTEKYRRVFVGARTDREPGAMEVADSAATKQALVHILSRYRGDDPYIDSALAILTHRPLDYARCVIHRLRGDFNE